MNWYQKQIGEILRAESEEFKLVQPRHVEAWMRLEHGTLDALSKDQFRSEVFIGAIAALEHPTESEQLAQSFGL